MAVSQVDVEDRTVMLQGDEFTIRSVLDTLTSCCMQMAELLQSGRTGDRAAANSLNALLKKSKKTVELPTADQVEFWKSPEKSGWMYSQGEMIKTWRRRWFVLKQGFLFRFAGPDVGAASKPRGIVDLSQVTDVSDGSAATGRPNSIKLSTATGSKCYITDSETAQVEWISALEGTVARLVKIIAGDGEEEEEGSPASMVSRALADQYKSYTGSSSGRRDQRGYEAPPLPEIIGASSGFGGARYGNGGGGGAPYNQVLNVVNYGESTAPASAPGEPMRGAYHGAGGEYVTLMDYSSVAGAQMAPVYAEPSTAGGSGAMYSSVYSHQTTTAPTHGAPMAYGNYGLPSTAADVYSGGYAAAPQSVREGSVSGGSAADYGAQQQQYYGGHQMAGGTLLDAVTAPPGAQAGRPPTTDWQVHYATDGRPYYYNSVTKETTWQAPAGA